MRALFTDNWVFRRGSESAGIPVRLPHDAMISQKRVPDGGTEGHGGFFPGGTYSYAKRWIVPDDADKREYDLVFEGVYGKTRVVLDDREIARWNSGYRESRVPLRGLTPGAQVSVVVEVDNSAVPNSRWYTGSGIYRPLWLESRPLTRICADGISVVTREINEGAATVDVNVRVEGPSASGLEVHVECMSDRESITKASSITKDDGKARLVLDIQGAKLWSDATPNLYDFKIVILAQGQVIDEQTIRTGLRTIKVDAKLGLRVNGKPVLLRGAAVHHDNGILGSATFADSEYRRARTLKEAGYNAIRSAHNPLSNAFLDACDELGLYVMDELTDVWFNHKTAHDEAKEFRSEWKTDAAAMITKDRNRPSVIMYSIGNEIAEVGWGECVELAEEIQAFLKQQDPTRPTTIASNPLLVMMAGKEPKDGSADKPVPERQAATSTAANMMTAKLGRMMVLASLLPGADKATRKIFEVVDIAGYNYAYASYPGARKRYPNRVIVGTESMPGDLPAIWRRVTSVPGVIGDFNWTGWDYLGEVGLGYWSYGTEIGGISKPYPGILAGSGVFDITGKPGALLLLAQAVWGITKRPGIAVRPLDKGGMRANRTPWLATDAVQSWSWGSLRGMAEIEVYSADDQVELFLNGRSLGRKAAGKKKDFVARFKTPYEPGELVAIGYTGSKQTERSLLRTAKNPTLRLHAESNELNGPDALAYVWVEISDETGTVDFSASDEIAIDVNGSAVLAGYGSANPVNELGFSGNLQELFRGQALAVIRGSNETGTVIVTARSSKYGDKSIELTSSQLETANK